MTLRDSYAYVDYNNINNIIVTGTRSQIYALVIQIIYSPYFDDQINNNMSGTRSRIYALV